MSNAPVVLDGGPAPSDLAQGHRLFSILTGVATVVFFSERHFVNEVNYLGPIPVPFVVPVVAAFAMVLRPSSVPLALAFWSLHTLFLLLEFPEANTNQTLLFFVGLAVLCSALGRLRVGKRLEIGEWFGAYAATLKWCVVALYFWTIVHKLNTDFFRPEVSCSSGLGGRLWSRLGLGNPPESANLWLLVATVAAEAFLPIGLFFRSTQRAAALFGLVFHWLLGVSGFYGFSSTMMALLSALFLFPIAGRSVAGFEAVLFTTGRFGLRAATVNRLVWIGYVGMLTLAKAKGISPGWLGLGIWYGVPVYAAVLLWLNWGGRQRVLESLRLVPESLLAAWRKPRPLQLLAACVFLNGLSPFLGAKTEYSFAMYSNLRTEGGQTNHFFLRPIPLFSYQTDLVEVLPGSDPALMERFAGRPVTRFELQSAVWSMHAEQGRTQIALALREGDVTRTFTDAEAHAETSRKPTFLERRLLFFRKIVPSAPNKCAH